MFVSNRSSLPVVVIALVMLIAVAAVAQDGGLTLLGRWDAGTCRAVAVDGHRAFIGDGTNLTVLDCADPAAPVELGQLAFPHPVEVVACRGDVALVAADGTVVVVVDVSGPAAPAPLATLPFVDVHDIVFADDLACVIDTYGLHVVDLTDPAAPVELGSLFTYSVDAGLAVSADGATLFIARADPELLVVDLSDPTQPAIIGDYYSSFATSFEDVAVYDENRVVAGAEPAGLYVIDVSDPAAPFLLVRVDHAGLESGSIAIGGEILHVLETNQGDHGLASYDLGDPATPVRVGVAPSPVHAAQIVAVADRCYAAAGDRGLAVFDVADPAAPAAAGGFATGGALASVEASGTIAVAAAGEAGLQILDVGDPASPILLGDLDVGGRATGVALRDDFAFVTGDQLHVVDISDPTAPAIVGECQPTYCGSIVLDGGYAYLMGGIGLSIVWIGNPTGPITEASYDCGFVAEPVDVALHGDYAYLYFRNTSSGFIRILDVSHPWQPTIVGAAPLVDLLAIEIGGGYLYAGSEEGFEVYDLADPLAPALIAQIDTPECESLLLTGHHVCMGTVDGGVAVIDVTDPTAPVLTAAADLGANALGLAVSGSRLFAAVPDHGLWILDHGALVGVGGELPASTVALEQNRPNPFNPRTEIRFTLAESGAAELSIFDVSGRHVRRLVAGDVMAAGEHTVVWDGLDGQGAAVATGVYFYRLSAGGATEVRKMTVVR